MREHELDERCLYSPRFWETREPGEVSLNCMSVDKDCVLQVPCPKPKPRLDLCLTKSPLGCGRILSRPMVSGTEPCLFLRC